MEVNKKFEVLEKKEINTEERSVVAWGNRPVLDRDQELVAADAKWELANFRKNPVLMLSHNYSHPPVGRILWAKATPDGLRFKAQFAKTQAGEELWTLYRDGIMSAFSIGFIPLKWEEPEEIKSGGPRRIFKQLELLEISCVSVPSCPAALVELQSAGQIKTKGISDVIELIIKESPNDQEQTEEKAVEEEVAAGTDSDGQEEKEVVLVIEGPEDVVNRDATVNIDDVDVSVEKAEIVNKPETTDNYHHVPVRSKNDFVSESFRTIDISADQGIKAVIGKLKSEPEGSTKIQKYLFDVEKWSMDEAKKWVEDHKKEAEPEIEKEPEKDCDCEEFSGEDAVCAACGGRRKPKKSEEDEKSLSDEISRMVREEFEKNMQAFLDSKTANQESPNEEDSFDDNISLLVDKIGKSGRVLSDRNRRLVQDAISMLSSLLESTAPNSDDDDDDEEKIAPEPEIEFVVENKDLSLDDVTKALADIVNSKMSQINLDAMVLESIKRVKGEVF